MESSPWLLPDTAGSALTAEPALCSEAPASTRKSVTVVIPALNEAGAIGNVVRQLSTRYPEYEILVVDDGSTDHTGRLAAAAGAASPASDGRRDSSIALIATRSAPASSAGALRSCAAIGRWALG